MSTSNTNPFTSEIGNWNQHPSIAIENREKIKNAILVYLGGTIMPVTLSNDMIDLAIEFASHKFTAKKNLERVKAGAVPSPMAIALGHALKMYSYMLMRHIKVAIPGGEIDYEMYAKVLYVEGCKFLEEGVASI